MTRRQLARERRAFNRARRGPALREPFRALRWPEGCCDRRWWSAWQGTRAQRRAADAVVRELDSALRRHRPSAPGSACRILRALRAEGLDVRCVDPVAGVYALGPRFLG